MPLRILIANSGYDAAWTRTKAGYGANVGPTGAVATSAATAASSAAALSPNIPFSRNTMTTPIALGVNTAVAVVSAQPLRQLLVIQNNSQATPPDTAPTLYIGIGQPVQAGWTLAIAPGAGVAFEVSPPLEQLYAAWGTYSDTNNTAVVQGCIIQSINVQPSSAAT